MDEHIRGYFQTLHDRLDDVGYSDGSRVTISRADAFGRASGVIRRATSADNKLMIIGNGGSAGIASHVAIDFSKSAGMRALAFNDSAALTCLANDLGYEAVFAEQIALHGRPGDVLVAISSSGNSPNIVRGVGAARSRGCLIITLSGFAPDNPLRVLGDINFYLSSREYGIVEIGHLAILHCLLDLTTAGVLDGRR
jgi:D-sedoheptulose 7-phosphate isomerase